jgi:hypothetical protein
MGSRSEGVEMSEKTAWHAVERASGRHTRVLGSTSSTRSEYAPCFRAEGGRSSEFMSNPG